MQNDHPFVLITRSEIARMIARHGRLNEAAQLLTEVASDRRRVLGDDHPDTLTTCHWLAGIAEQQDRNAEARELYDRSAQRRRANGQGTRPKAANSNRHCYT